MKSLIWTFSLLMVGVIVGFNLATSQKVAFVKSSIEDSLSRLVLNPSLNNIAQKCEIPFENNMLEEPKKILVIGHAYGSSQNMEGDISPSITDFLASSNDRFEEIIFTGDVFHTPSIQKWKRLKIHMQELGLKFSIAPGNHDVGNIADNGLREIFFQEFSKSFPIIEERESKIMIFLDSTMNPGKIDTDVIKFLEQSSPSSKTVFIFAHHLLRPQPQLIANGLTGHSLDINNIDVLTKASNKFKNIFVISGDAGIVKQDVDCLRYKNIFFISSGIGGTQDDQLLILDGTDLTKRLVN